MLGVALLLPLATAATVLGSFGVAEAGTQHVTNCTVSGNVTISPGITTTPKIQTLSSSGTSTGCGGSETGGTFTTAPSKGKTATSCKTLGKKSVSTTTENIKWNDATTSTAKITLTLVLATATITGTVTGGHFAGDTVSGKITYKLIGKCAKKPPITKATFTGKSSA